MDTQFWNSKINSDLMTSFAVIFILLLCTFMNNFV
jgi:hypothetical protein